MKGHYFKQISRDLFFFFRFRYGIGRVGFLSFFSHRARLGAHRSTAKVSQEPLFSSEATSLNQPIPVLTNTARLSAPLIPLGLSSVAIPSVAILYVVLPVARPPRWDLEPSNVSMRDYVPVAQPSSHFLPLTSSQARLIY